MTSPPLRFSFLKKFAGKVEYIIKTPCLFLTGRSYSITSMNLYSSSFFNIKFVHAHRVYATLSSGEFDSSYKKAGTLSNLYFFLLKTNRNLPCIIFHTHSLSEISTGTTFSIASAFPSLQINVTLKSFPAFCLTYSANSGNSVIST